MVSHRKFKFAWPVWSERRFDYEIYHGESFRESWRKLFKTHVQSQTHVDTTNTKKKKKTLNECGTKNSRGLICLTDQLQILQRAAKKVLSGCLSFTSIPYPIASYWNPTYHVKNFFKTYALSCFERALCLLPRRNPPGDNIVYPLKKPFYSWTSQ